MIKEENKEKENITKEYLKLIRKYGLKKVFRLIDSKTFVSRYDFEAYMRDLYSTKDGRYCVVWKYDPEPGGYGEEFVLIEGMTELIEIENAETMSEEEIIEYVSKNAGKISL